MLRRTSKLRRLMSELDRLESALNRGDFDRPKWSAGSGESVALTFSRIGGASKALIGVDVRWGSTLCRAGVDNAL